MSARPGTSRTLSLHPSGSGGGVLLVLEIVQVFDTTFGRVYDFSYESNHRNRRERI